MTLSLSAILICLLLSAMAKASQAVLQVHKDEQWSASVRSDWDVSVFYDIQDALKGDINNRYPEGPWTLPDPRERAAFPLAIISPEL